MLNAVYQKTGNVAQQNRHPPNMSPVKNHHEVGYTPHPCVERNRR